jgi:hypothetical protein
VNVLRPSIAAVLVSLSLAAPAFAQSDAQAAGANAVGWSWWSSATPDQKQFVVRGELDGIQTGYLEPQLILLITQALTGNATVKTLADNLKKTPPKFSKTPADYVTAIDGIYADADAHKLSVGIVLACLADSPFGATTTDQCIAQFEK